MEQTLYDILMYRLRDDLSDLSDDEFEVYLTTLMSCGCSKLMQSMSQYNEVETTTTSVSYKEVRIRGAVRRVPVSVTSSKTSRPTIPPALNSADGSAFIRHFMQITDSATTLEADLMQHERIFSVINGFALVGDIVFAEGVWGVVTDISVVDNTFKMMCLCDTLLNKSGSISTIEQNYRVIP